MPFKPELMHGSIVTHALYNTYKEDSYHELWTVVRFIYASSSESRFCLSFARPHTQKTYDSIIQMGHPTDVESHHSSSDNEKSECSTIKIESSEGTVTSTTSQPELLAAPLACSRGDEPKLDLTKQQIFAGRAQLAALLYVMAVGTSQVFYVGGDVRSLMADA